MEEKKNRKPNRKPEQDEKKPYRKSEQDEKKPYRKSEQDEKKSYRKQESGEKKPFRKPDQNGKKPSLKRGGEEKTEAVPQSRSVKPEGPTCPYMKKCGGCKYLGMSYEKQLELKEKELKKTLKGIVPVKGILGMKEPFHYRNKVHAVFSRTQRGEIVSGIYEEGTHRVVPVKTCLLEDEKADAIIGDIRKLCKAFKIRIYDEDTGYGLLRHVLIRTGYATGQIMVVLICASPIFPDKNHFVQELRALHPELTTIVLNVNERHTNMVMGKRDIPLYGKGYIEDELCGCTFRISPQSFYQVNPEQTRVLYEKAIELAQLTGSERAFDAYCGTGTIGLIASRGAREVISVELNKDAVKDAISNAKRNGINNVQFYQGDAGEFLTKMALNGEKADVVFLDPPRAGSDEAFLSSVVQMQPKRIVYVSCNPETLARDLKYLTNYGYSAREAWGVDLFAWTGHVECVTVLTKSKKRVVFDQDAY